MQQVEQIVDNKDVVDAYQRIFKHVKETPLIKSDALNKIIGHEIIFKCEPLQKTGAFKIRGALNALIKLNSETSNQNTIKYKEVVTFSSGNHAQGVALAAAMLGMKATVYMTNNSSKIKQIATRSYGAEVILTETRAEAEKLAAEKAKQGAFFLHPFDNNEIIAGQGTACYETLLLDKNFSGIFSPLGGGGLTSGTFLAAKAHNIPVFAGEPLNANDAAESLRSGKIYRLLNAPQTLADGAKTLSIVERTFHFLKQIAGVYEITEEEIIFWVQNLVHFLKISVEPTAVLAMAAASRWLKQQDEKNAGKQRILVILSGGNIDQESHSIIWQEDHVT